MSNKFKKLREKFKDGDWVFGLGEHKGCSACFSEGDLFYPFSYLDDYNPDNYRLATEEEIKEARLH